MELEFKRDTSFRKQFFTPESFAHPAKMDSNLLLWIVEKYTSPGDVILDPMAGMGTTMLACTLGRDVVLVELEEKFCKMMGDNWEIVKTKPQLGYSIGTCQIIQGDARQLEGLLVDKIVTSPPYGNATKNLDDIENWDEEKANRIKELQNLSVSMMQLYSDNPNNIGNLPYGQIDNIVTSPPYEEAMGQKHHSPRADKLAQEKSNPVTYTERVDSIITSPPYEGSDVSQTHMTSDKRGDPSDPNYRPSWKRKLAEGYAETKRPYHEVDSIITSPPYENQGQGQGKEYHPERMVGPETGLGRGYGDEIANIGNLKSDSYLEAMFQVYQNCFAVLKNGGLMILVTKNFIRNKQIIRLDEDTIKLCEQVGFQFVERHYRKLPSQSFWRVIYAKKYPDAPVIDKEDIIVFRK